MLISFMLYQYYHAHVTQPLILEQHLEFGIDISSGQVNRIITEGKERYHAEKDEILRAGLEVSRYIHVDDTGARHQGRNGYCTHIGNELFAWFASTQSKSRTNFLELLRAGHAKGVWFRLRRVLMNAEAAYAVSEKEARRLLDEGLLPEPVGGDLEPPKTLIFIDRESLKEIEGRRKIPISLGHEFLEARWLVLVRQG